MSSLLKETHRISLFHNAARIYSLTSPVVSQVLWTQHKPDLHQSGALTCFLFFLFGGAFAHSQIDWCLLWGNGDLFNVFSPLCLEQLTFLFLFHSVLLFLRKNKYRFV